ncbi:hypothetical protein H6G81_01495 [Scytonema hofmannii FACHB-248]|uniref:Uncharacterized protein n=1 Tax=Scytonema hofmannii FACHB-248 TaxID=1842502 RepID=A0ABR8GIM9_9CYAN|nr:MULTISPECIES: hypothetical protein [Nostocales]MBD2603229.1 hypothetical protein [Scytonema hofmannii FACHB-248]
MTNADQPQDSRLDRIEAVLDTVAMRLDTLTRQQTNTQHQLDDLVSTANSIFARNAIMNDVLLELRENSEQHQRSFEQHQRNFEEHQRTTNAALQSLEAILLQLIRG